MPGKIPVWICCWSDLEVNLLRSVMPDDSVGVMLVWDIREVGGHVVVLRPPAPVGAEEQVRQRQAIRNAKAKTGLGCGFVEL